MSRGQTLWRGTLGQGVADTAIPNQKNKNTQETTRDSVPHGLLKYRNTGSKIEI